MAGNREEVDYFENHSYWFIRLCLFYTGLWPYANRRTRFIASFVPILALTVVTFSSLFKFIALLPRLESVIYVLGFLSIVLMNVFAYFMNIYNIAQLKKLWQHVENDWKKLKKMNKISIAERYAGKSNLLSLYIAILVTLYFILTYFDTFLPYILDVIIPTKEPNSLKIPFSIELFGKYTLSLTLVMVFFFMLIAILTIIGVSKFIIFVQHGCLLFSVTGNILEHGFVNIEENNNAIDKDETLYKAIVQSIKYHRAAIRFSKSIEDTYTLLCFCILINVITVLSSDSLRLFHMILSKNMFSTIARFLLIFCIVGIAFVVTHTGQLLIDHSVDVFDKICSLPWHILSLRTQKLLLIMLTRATKPSYLTDGKIVILSHRLFTMLLHSTISVTTMFISMR